jgi:hypothetical protein
MSDPLDSLRTRSFGIFNPPEPVASPGTLQELAPLWRSALIFLGLIAALLMAHHPILLSFFRLTQRDPGDSRLINYLLEHTWRWVTMQPLHTDFWNAPFFYPESNAFAYSDVFLSFAPLYWVWRFLGLQPDTAYQFYYLSVTAVNYAAFYLFLRRSILASIGASVVGALFFAAANMRVGHVTHQQLALQIFVVLALTALWQLFKQPPGKTSPTAWIWIFALSITLQFWGGFYMASFMCLSTGLLCFFAAILPASRKQFFVALWNHWRVILLAGVASIVLTTPLLLQLAVASKVNTQPEWDFISMFLPRPRSWFYLGYENFLYRWMDHLDIFHTMQVREEQALGLGFLTTLTVISGLLLVWRRVSSQILILYALSIIGIFTLFAGKYSIWRSILDCFPQTGALRDPARIGLLLLIPAAIGLTYAIDRCAKRFGTWVAILLATLCLAEQLTTTQSYDKLHERRIAQNIAARVPRTAIAFFYTASNSRPYYLQALDAMWASLYCNVPTVDGYSGIIPRTYSIWMVYYYNDIEDIVRGKAQRWLADFDVDPTRVCWITDDGPMFFGNPPRKPTYRLGDRIFLGYVTPYLGPGWSITERDFGSWNNGHVANINLNIQDPPVDCVLSFKIVGFYRDGKPQAQRLRISVNGKDIGEQILPKRWERLHFEVPASCLNAGENVITLTYPDALSPQSIGLRDGRTLAGAVQWFRLGPAESIVSQ